MSARSTEPVSRRGGPVRPALSRSAIVEAGLAIADREGVDQVTMRRVADVLDTGASALYVYVDSRDDLLQAMFDHAMAPLADATPPTGDWQQRLRWLILEAINSAGGHGGLAEVALTGVPSGPNATRVTNRVRELLVEGGLSEDRIPAALDLLSLFIIAAALDRVPAAAASRAEHRDLLGWETETIIRGLASAR